MLCLFKVPQNSHAYVIYHTLSLTGHIRWVKVIKIKFGKLQREQWQTALLKLCCDSEGNYANEGL